MTLVALDAKRLRALDATALMMGLSTEVLMDRAGGELARVLADRFGRDRTFLFLVGPGNNGGDGLVACRYLANLGFQVSALLVGVRSGTSLHNERLLVSMEVPAYPWGSGFSFSPYDVLVDCLLGYGQRGAPANPVAAVLRAAAASGKTVVACDVPSGLGVSSGEVFNPALPASLTVSFAAPKTAFDVAAARSLCGEVLVVGIGIPFQVYAQLGLSREEVLVEGVAPYP